MKPKSKAQPLASRPKYDDSDVKITPIFLESVDKALGSASPTEIQQ